MDVLYIVGGLPNEKIPFYQPFVKSQMDSLVKQSINITILSINGYESFYNYFGAIKKLKQIINEKQIHIIHAHYSYSALPAILLKPKIPIVLSLMGSDLLGSPNQKGRMTIRGYFDKYLSMYISGKVNYLIVKSEEMRKQIKNNPAVEVIPNGIDFNFFKPRDRNLARKGFNFKEEDFLVLFLGSKDNYVKNFNLAKNSFEIFRKKFPNAKFLNPYGVSSKDVVNYMNASDALLLTSFWEGSPNVIKEAMACNLPIVSTDVGDVRKVVSDTRNCFVVSYSPDDIADKLSAIYNNNNRSNGRSKIEYLSDNIIAAKIINIYEKTLTNYYRKNEL